MDDSYTTTALQGGLFVWLTAIFMTILILIGAIMKWPILTDFSESSVLNKNIFIKSVKKHYGQKGLQIFWIIFALFGVMVSVFVTTDLYNALYQETGKNGDTSCVYEVLFSSTNELYRVYIVNGFIVGNDKASLRDYLNLQKKGDIIFRSDYTLLPEVEDELENIFTSLNFQIKQFWIPVPFDNPDSTFSGWVDLKGKE